MKQIAPNYSYNKTTGLITLTGVNIDRDQLLLIVNTTRNVIYYNFADSATTLQAFTQGANTSVTLATSVVSASSTHNNADALTIYYDDQTNTVTANNTNLNRLVQDGDITDTFGVPIVYARVAGGALDYWKEVNQNSGLPVANQLNTGGDIVPFAISGTVTANTGLSQPLTDTQLRATAVPVSIASVPSHAVTGPLTDTQLRATAVPISGTVTANTGLSQPLTDTQLRATAVPVSIASVPSHAVTGPLTDTQLRATAVPVSGTLSVNNSQGSTVTQSAFSSTTASTALVSSNSSRKVLTVFNEGAGVLHISAGSTCTITAYQVKLGTGEYWEAPSNQTSLAHTGVFSASGTARITEIA